jgi:hypothetical protein
VTARGWALYCSAVSGKDTAILTVRVIFLISAFRPTSSNRCIPSRSGEKAFFFAELISEPR